MGPWPHVIQSQIEYVFLELQMLCQILSIFRRQLLSFCHGPFHFTKLITVKL